MTSLLQPPLITRLLAAESILIAGAGGGFDVYAGLPIALALRAAGKQVHLANFSSAGGGFDVYAGLPIALALRAAGKQVHLANFSFTHLYGLPLEVWADPDVAMVRPDTPGPEGYFPERTLARWLHRHRMPDTVWAFPSVGVQPLRDAYRSLVARLGVDAVLLVDGGTDILMRGDEAGLGTPEEDMASLAAVAGLTEVPERLVACLGFGIDAFHGVNHALVLENLAALDRSGGYLGAFSVPRDSREGALYLDAVEHARAAFPEHPSIVNGSVAAALRGEFGDVRFTERTKGSDLFVNPLMAVYFGVTVEALAAEHLYLDRLERTVVTRQIATVIAEFQDELPRQRPPRQFPH